MNWQKLVEALVQQGQNFVEAHRALDSDNASNNNAVAALVMFGLANAIRDTFQED